MSMMPGPERRFRAGPHGYIVWSVIFGGMAALAVWNGRHVHPSWWEVAVLFVALWLFAVVWLRSFEIRLTPDDLIFRSLFGRERKMRLSEITAIRYGLELHPTRGPLRLTVDSTSGETMSINAKVFSAEAIRAVTGLRKPE